MKVVVVEEGVRTELEFQDRAVISIGRAIDNDIRLADNLASRHHCRIEASPEGVWVIDLGSSNGTLVNGERVKRKMLAADDRLRVGRATIDVIGWLETAADPPAGETQRILASAAEATPEGGVGMLTLTGEAREERENLRVFAQITREILRETDLGRLLRLIVDSAVALSGAERGFLLLGEGTPADLAQAAAGAAGAPSAALEGMRVRVARSFDREDIPIPASRLSMGIARKVAESRQALISVDAGRDQRFDGMASVEDLKLRSVMCLPLGGPRAAEHEGHEGNSGHEGREEQEPREGPAASRTGSRPERGTEPRVEGVLYVDNRLQQSAFASDDLELMKLLADQAAIAIKNARLVAELRERNERLVQSARKIELLNEQLGRKVRDRDTELAVVRAELFRERGRYDYTAIVGASEGMRRVFQQLDRMIESELPVLIQGESGTGKELIARAIHFNGTRKDKAFVTENCAAMPDTLLESELFGHTRGAFTGAHRAKKGLLEQADGGTLFLDEIGDMSPEMQKKLLRVLQEGEFRSLGSNERVKVDVRVIAASHHRLDEMVAANEFREDLYYRVNVLTIDLPPLRERREDVPLLAEALLARAARDAGRPVPHLPREVLAALVAHDWPGNVRELENEMRRLIVLAEGEVRLEHLSSSVLERRGAHLAGASARGPGSPEASGSIREAVADLERRSIESALAAASGNKSRAAQALGISRFALQRKLDKYGLGRARATPSEHEGGEAEAGAGVEGSGEQAEDIAAGAGEA